MYRSSNKVCLIKSGRLRWEEHVARMEEGGNALKVVIGKPTWKIPQGLPGVGGRTILEYILKK